MKNDTDLQYSIVFIEQNFANRMYYIYMKESFKYKKKVLLLEKKIL